jgi:spore germination protein KC
MKKSRSILLAFIMLINSIFTTGCWNYKEVDKLLIVAGVAIDKGVQSEFLMTVEIIQISSGKDSKMTSKIISSEGKTMFDAARNMIAISGKRLYWSHAKIIILSRKIASEGLIRAIEWYNRDAETREDIHILISEGETAKEILAVKSSTEDINSFALDQVIANEDSLSKAPITDILKVDIELKSKGTSIVIPVIKLKNLDDKMKPEIMGTAIIKNDKLVGFLNGEETKDLIIIRNETKGGILIQDLQVDNTPISVSLEIFSSKSKVKPIVEGKNIKIKLDVDTIVAIDEITGSANLIDEDERKTLEKIAEKDLKERIENLIKKVQSEYDADIFGFGGKIREDKVKVWNIVESNWEEYFKNLKVDVKTKVHIENSSVLSKPIKMGE